jgi:hypothetical protein
MIADLETAPYNGWLSEKVEELLACAGRPPLSGSK